MQVRKQRPTTQGVLSRQFHDTHRFISISKGELGKAGNAFAHLIAIKARYSQTGISNDSAPMKWRDLRALASDS
jgi:hypothetical protein